MSIITAIEKQKNNKDRVSLFLDGEFAFGLDALSAAAHRLRVGDEISKEDLNALVFDSDVNSAFEKASKILGIRQRSQKEIKTYLLSKDYSQEVIEAVLTRLKQYGYVDDLAFARAFVDSYSKKHGKLYINMRLKEAGIASQIRDGVLDYSDADSALDCAQKYLKTRDNITRQKLYSFLYNKGFSIDGIDRALELMQEDGE